LRKRLLPTGPLRRHPQTKQLPLIEAPKKKKQLATSKLALTNLFHLSKLRFVLGVR
jgi:hypothetical protein